MAGENSKGKRKRLRSPDTQRRIVRELRDRIRHYEENPIPEPTDEERIRNLKSYLRDHIGASSTEKARRSATEALFFIEISPKSSRMGATCQHVTCTDRIKEGSYRIAVSPGMNTVFRNAGKVYS